MVRLMVLSFVMFDMRNPAPKRRGNLVEFARPPAQFARPVTLHLKQEPESDVHPFGFKPCQPASLIDPKTLETLQSMVTLM
jgi:hypothetical protein